MKIGIKKGSFLLLCLFLLFGLVGCGTSLLYADAEKYTAGNATVSETVRYLDIEWGAGEVRVIPSDADGIAIAEEADGDLSEQNRVHWYLDGDTLRIRETASGTRNWFSLPRDQKRLTVSVPVGATEEVSVSTGSAKISVESGAKSLRISTASGEVSLTASGAETVEIGTASGAVSLTASGAQTVSVDTASGNVSAQLSAVKVCEISTASGAVDLTGTEMTERLTVDSASGNIRAVTDVPVAEVDNASGDVTLDLRAIKSLSAETSSGNISLILPSDAGFTADADTAAGEFNCEFPTVRRDGKYVCADGAAVLKLSTASGDIGLRMGK